MSPASTFAESLVCAWKMTCTSPRTAPSYLHRRLHRCSIRSGLPERTYLLRGLNRDYIPSCALGNDPDVGRAHAAPVDRRGDRGLRAAHTQYSARLAIPTLGGTDLSYDARGYRCDIRGAQPGSGSPSL